MKTCFSKFILPFSHCEEGFFIAGSVCVFPCDASPYALKRRFWPDI